MRALRWILITVAVLAVVAALAIAAGTAWLNTYIASPAFKQEVEAMAGRTLNGTVQVEKINFDIWYGVKLDGLFYQIDPAHLGGPGSIQVRVNRVSCAYAWMDIFQRRLQMTGLTFDQPQIVLTKQPAPPPLEPPPTAHATGTVVKTTSSGSATSLPFQFILDRVKVKDGRISVQNVNGVSIVEILGVNSTVNTAGYAEGKEVKGTLRVADVALPANLHMTDFSTPFSYQNGTLEVMPFQASAFDGKLGGNYRFQPLGSTLDLNLKGLDMAQFTGTISSASSAKLSGSLDGQSKWRGIETGNLDGEGDLQLTDGKLEGVTFLQDLAQIFKIKELNDPIIKKAQTHFVVQDQQVKLIGLQIVSSFFQITGDGVAGLDGGLNADLVLILTRDAMAKLPKAVAASFVQKQDGTGSIAFRVTGTLSNPQTDLPSRMLMQNTQIQNVIKKTLNKFFH